jgi:hypothetical protein
MIARVAPAMLAVEEPMRGKRELKLKHAKPRPYVRGSRNRARHAARRERRASR